MSNPKRQLGALVRSHMDSPKLTHGASGPHGSKFFTLAAIVVVNALLAAGAVAQIPAHDARNGALPSGRMHFEMPVYKTLAEWEARAAHLRKQILSAAGLLPLPERTPLHPQIFGRLERQGYSVEKVLLETMPGFY